jgi:hypothetical protein
MSANRGLATLRALLAKAPPPPWRHNTGPGTWNGGDIEARGGNRFVTSSGPDGDIAPEAAALIVASVNALPALLDVIDAAHEALFDIYLHEGPTYGVGISERPGGTIRERIDRFNIALQRLESS